MEMLRHLGKEKVCCVYKIVNRKNGKIYIGSTKYFKSRISAHQYELKKGVHHNRKMQNVYNKYGEDIFKYEIIELCTPENQYDREQYYIDEYNVIKKGYNLCKNAKYGHLDYKNRAINQNPSKGETHFMATITEREAFYVKFFASLGWEVKDISIKTGVNQSIVGNILSFNCWKDVGLEFNDILKNRTNNKRLLLELASDECINTGAKIKVVAKKYNIKCKTLGKITYAKKNYILAQKEGRVISCVICGKEILIKNNARNRKYCDECKKEVQKKQSRRYMQNKRNNKSTL